MARVMYALTSVQGTAMGETALCENCYVSAGERALSVTAARTAGDWNCGCFQDCSQNDALVCQGCGYGDAGDE